MTAARAGRHASTHRSTLETSEPSSAIRGRVAEAHSNGRRCESCLGHCCRPRNDHRERYACVSWEHHGEHGRTSDKRTGTLPLLYRSATSRLCFDARPTPCRTGTYPHVAPTTPTLDDARISHTGNAKWTAIRVGSCGATRR